MSINEEENQLLNIKSEDTEAENITAEDMASGDKAVEDMASEDKAADALSFLESISPEPVVGAAATGDFHAQEIGDDQVVSTYEEAVRKIVLLQDRLKRKEIEILESQKLIESALAENRDNIEALEKAEAVNKKYERELEKALKDNKHEHDKRRLHLLHVRDLKHAISERDARIKQLEDGSQSSTPPPQPGMYAAMAISPSNADEIKKLQSDIFYKEIEMEKINSLLLAAQSESLSLKALNDELKNENETLKLEISYKENLCSELNTRISSLENEIVVLSEKCEAISQMEISAEDIEKLKLASEVKEFLESELDKISENENNKEEEADGGSDDDNKPNQPAEDDETIVSEGETAVEDGEGQKHLSELDEIKEKFKSLIAERDKAIALLDKFEVESKTNERELNELKLKHAELTGAKEAAENELKEKETELQGIYSAFSSYKEESGFMSRENKILKEERESLTAELEKLRKAVNEFETAAAAKEEEIKALTAETEEKLKTAADEAEKCVQSLIEEKEEELQRIKINCETDVETYKSETERCKAELDEFKAVVEELRSKYQTALADYQGIRLNVESLLSGIGETLKLDNAGGGPESSSEAPLAIENELVILDDDNQREPEDITALFESFAQNSELKITKTGCCSVEDENFSIRPVLYVFNACGEDSLIRVIELAPVVNAPMVLYSKNDIAVHKITELISRGVIEDYIGPSMNEAVIQSVMTRVLDGRLSKIQKVSVKKDNDEIKLRESVALTIDNRVKAGRIEALNDRVVYLQGANRRLRESIARMQELFDQIIARITAISLQEIPQNISEGFNEITGILLKITSIKL